MIVSHHHRPSPVCAGCHLLSSIVVARCPPPLASAAYCCWLPSGIAARCSPSLALTAYHRWLSSLPLPLATAHHLVVARRLPSHVTAHHRLPLLVACHRTLPSIVAGQSLALDDRQSSIVDRSIVDHQSSFNR